MTSQPSTTHTIIELYAQHIETERARLESHFRESFLENVLAWAPKKYRTYFGVDVMPSSKLNHEKIWQLTSSQ